jgi:hypothetical protein
VLHRLAPTQVGGQGQRRHELGNPDASPIYDRRHGASLDPRHLPITSASSDQAGLSTLAIARRARASPAESWWSW